MLDRCNSSATSMFPLQRLSVSVAPGVKGNDLKLSS
jgi:hypothetical protein